MSKKRITAPWGTTFVHIVSRTVDKDFKFKDPADKKMMRDILRRAAKFSGVRVITFGFLDNHFHILAAIPPRPKEIPLNVVLERIGILYEGQALDALLAEWDRIEEEDGEEALEEFADTFRRRMYDMGEFVKTFKQRVTLRYNKLHHRDGTLWGSRYKSVLVQGDPYGIVLRSMAAYLFTGYGEAMSGDEEAQKALMEILPPIGDGSWEDFDAKYRELLYVSEERKKGPVAAKRLENVMNARYSLPKFLRQTVRFFSDGLALGDKDFVNSVFQAHRGHFGTKRKDGARSIPYCADWRGHVYSARDLRKDPVTPLTG